VLALLLMIAGFLATLIPASRAASNEPIKALRSEVSGAETDELRRKIQGERTA
jgi:hypothetical protein